MQDFEFMFLNIYFMNTKALLSNFQKNFRARVSGQNQDRSGKYSTFFTDSTKIPLKGNFIKENNFKDKTENISFWNMWQQELQTQKKKHLKD